MWMTMVENKGYVPTLTEWDELVLLWNKSRAVLASTLAPNVKARIAWTAKQFADAHAHISIHQVYAWLEKNLAVAVGLLAGTHWHEEPTAVYKRAVRGTSHEHIKDFQASEPVVAGGSRSD